MTTLQKAARARFRSLLINLVIVALVVAMGGCALMAIHYLEAAR